MCIVAMVSLIVPDANSSFVSNANNVIFVGIGSQTDRPTRLRSSFRQSPKVIEE
jgi:hypothetical protein